MHVSIELLITVVEELVVGREPLVRRRHGIIRIDEDFGVSA